MDGAHSVSILHSRTAFQNALHQHAINYYHTIVPLFSECIRCPLYVAIPDIGPCFYAQKTHPIDVSPYVYLTPIGPSLKNPFVELAWGSWTMP